MLLSFPRLLLYCVLLTFTCAIHAEKRVEPTAIYVGPNNCYVLSVAHLAGFGTPYPRLVVDEPAPGTHRLKVFVDALRPEIPTMYEVIVTDNTKLNHTVESISRSLESDPIIRKKTIVEAGLPSVPAIEYFHTFMNSDKSPSHVAMNSIYIKDNLIFHLTANVILRQVGNGGYDADGVDAMAKREFKRLVSALKGATLKIEGKRE